MVERVLKPTRGDAGIHKFIRYSLVSVVAVGISQVVILVCTLAFGFSGVLANTIGCVVSTPASYELNRKWAWGKEGKSHLWREVVPFWGLTLVGFIFSEGTTQWADNMAHSHDVTGLLRSLAIMGASLFAWGVVWIVKFVIFNRLVFAERGSPPEQQPADREPAQAASPEPAKGASPEPPPVLESPAHVGR